MDLVTIEKLLCLGRALGEKVEEELERLFALSTRGLDEAAQHTMVFQAVLRTGSLHHFAHSHHQPQTGLGLVDGRRDEGMAEASEEVLLKGS